MGKLTLSFSSEKQAKIISAIDNFSKTDMTSSEANTKKKIIEPLLDILDWDTRSNEVRLEYPIKIGARTSYVDYALTLENKPVIFVEAKPFSSELSTDDSEQVISYGRIEDVKWAVLTNGRQLKLFDTEQGKKENESLVTEIDLRELPNKDKYLNLLRRESILTGQIEEAAKRLAATRNAINRLKKNKGAIAEKFKKNLLEITGSEVENRVESISNQLADRAIRLFEKSAKPSRVQETDKITSAMREELAEKREGKAVLCISKVEGIEFLKKYNAWGFVRMAREDVSYFALYVGRPKSSVMFFGEIDSITQPLESKEDLVKIQEKDAKTFETGKRVIHLKPGTLTELKNPIPLKNKLAAPRRLRYTTLKKLVQAEKVSDL